MVAIKLCFAPLQCWFHLQSHLNIKHLDLAILFASCLCVFTSHFGVTMETGKQWGLCLFQKHTVYVDVSTFSFLCEGIHLLDVFRFLIWLIWVNLTWFITSFSRKIFRLIVSTGMIILDTKWFRSRKWKRQILGRQRGSTRGSGRDSSLADNAISAINPAHRHHLHQRHDRHVHLHVAFIF